MATAATAIHARAERVADQRIPGILLFVLAGQFMTVIMLAASIAPGYDLNRSAISDLGVIPETALLFNASLVAVGLLNIVGGWAYHRTHGRGWILALYLVAGLGALGAGLVPLNTNELHGLFALFAFLFFNLQAIASGTLVSGPMRVISIVAGLAGLAFVALMVIGDSGNAAAFGAMGHGGAERMIVYPPMLWMLAFGGYLTARREETQRP